MTEPMIAHGAPMADLGLYLADMAAWPRSGRDRPWLDANDAFRRRMLEQLAASGPLSSRDIPDTCEVPWASTGWTNDRNVTQMLEFLASRGEVAVAGRRGRQRLWDLAERVYPPASAVVRRTRRAGARRATAAVAGRRPPAGRRRGGYTRRDRGHRRRVAGRSDATAEGFEGRTALLSPFDRLIHDRARAVDLFDFEYTLEMYKPKDKRRWGYFALPVLHHDRLVGKVDATVDRAARGCRSRRSIRTCGSPERSPPSRRVEALARWLGLDDVRIV